MKEPNDYNPNANYYMLSVFDNTDVRWIRNQFMTEEELRDWHVALLTDKGRYSNFQIFNENVLDLVSRYPATDGGNDCEMTLRESLFGSNYQWYADYLRNGAVEELMHHN